MTTSDLRRQLKNLMNNYTKAEIKVREATSNDPWGPSSSLMSEIADLTFKLVPCYDVMSTVWKRLTDSRPYNWRHVYKGLTLLDYLLKIGSERVDKECREKIVTLQKLRDFQFVDRNGRDQGAYVRKKACQLVCLLLDNKRLRQERIQALLIKERMAEGGSGEGEGVYGDIPLSSHPASSLSPRATSEMEQARPQTRGEEESQLQLALAMSREKSQRSAMLVEIFGPSSEALPVPSDPWNTAPPPCDITSDTWDSVGVHSNASLAGSTWTATPSCSNSSNPWAPGPKSRTGLWAVVSASSSPVNRKWDSPPDRDAELFTVKVNIEPLVKEDSMPNPFGTDPFVKPQVSGRGPEMFDLSRLSAPPTQVCQTQEAFLGPTGASLVNLDALITSNPPSKTHNNPFLSVGLSALSPTNPFYCDQPCLALNQMRPSSTSPLPPHTLTYSPSLSLPLPHQFPIVPSSLTRPPAGLPDLPSNLPQPLTLLPPPPVTHTQPQTQTCSHNPFL